MSQRRAVFPHLLVFASGSNHAGEIAGFGSIGQHVGVAAPELNEAAIQALLALPPHVHVFVDSGAFSEVVFTPAPTVVHPISHAEWQRRLALYARLSPLGSRLHVVAPDQVGSQAETLRRLHRYAAEVRALAATGAEVLVPLQRGTANLLDFEHACATVLGWGGFTPAIPMKKQATSIPDLLAWIRVRQPHRVHLLGLGERNPEAESLLAAIGEASPGTKVSLDANRITASVGRSEAKRRVLTAATDTVQGEVLADVWGDAYQESIGTPEDWLSKGALKKVGVAAGLTDARLRAWVRDPSGFLASDPDEQPMLSHELDNAWNDYAHGERVVSRKRDAIVLAFGPELREVSPRTLLAALRAEAIEDMQRPGTRTFVVAEDLDDPGFRKRVEHVIARALTTLARAVG